MRKRRVQKGQSQSKLNIELLGDTTYQQQLQDALSTALPKQYLEVAETHCGVVCGGCIPEDLPVCALKTVLEHRGCIPAPYSDCLNCWPDPTQ